MATWRTCHFDGLTVLQISSKPPGWQLQFKGALDDEEIRGINNRIIHNRPCVSFNSDLNYIPMGHSCFVPYCEFRLNDVGHGPRERPAIGGRFDFIE